MRAAVAGRRSDGATGSRGAASWCGRGRPHGGPPGAPRRRDAGNWSPALDPAAGLRRRGGVPRALRQVLRVRARLPDECPPARQVRARLGGALDARAQQPDRHERLPAQLRRLRPRVPDRRNPAPDPRREAGPRRLRAAGPVRIGLASVDRGRCLPWAMDRPCIVCEENCPVTPKAIYVTEVEQTVRDGVFEVVSANGATLAVRGARLTPGRFASGDYFCKLAGEERGHPIVANTEDTLTFDPSEKLPEAVAPGTAPRSGPPAAAGRRSRPLHRLRRVRARMPDERPSGNPRHRRQRDARPAATPSCSPSAPADHFPMNTTRIHSPAAVFCGHPRRSALGRCCCPPSAGRPRRARPSRAGNSAGPASTCRSSASAACSISPTTRSFCARRLTTASPTGTQP